MRKTTPGESKKNLANAANLLKEFIAIRKEQEKKKKKDAKKTAPVKKAAGPKKTKAKSATERVTIANKAAAAKPVSTSHSQAGRLAG